MLQQDPTAALGPHHLHDDTYSRDVLRLPDGQTEDDIERQLKGQAHVLGVDVGGEAPPHQHPPTVPQRTSPRLTSRISQDSIASRPSQSTGMTSLASDLSGRAAFRTSLTFRDYDAFLARGLPNGRHSISGCTPAASSLSSSSLPLSSAQPSPRKHFRKLRVLSILRRCRSSSRASLPTGCPHCPHDRQSQRRAAHQLPCGHKLCTQALRDTIEAAMDGPAGLVPTCCGLSIPGQVVEDVMTQTEQQSLLDRLEQWNEAVSIAPSMSSARDSVISKASPGLTADQRTESSQSSESKTKLTTVDSYGDLEGLVDLPQLQNLREEQDDERDRFQVWVAQQRLRLEAHHQGLQAVLKRNHLDLAQTLEQRHTDAVADAEDKQVKAEADLRAIHKQERGDNTTALKHMEAYCAGTYSTGELHQRVITTQDRAELDKTRHMRDQMDVKHESQINVLRGEQGRRMRRREQRQDVEMYALVQMLETETLTLRNSCTKELQTFQATVEEKQHHAAVRWQLQTAILVKKHEMSTLGEEVEERFDATAGAEATFGFSTGFTMRPAA